MRESGPKAPSILELLYQSLQSTERGYDLLAPKFDQTPFRTPDRLIHATLDSWLEQDGEVKDALDLATGTGAALHKLSDLAIGAVVGLDRSREMLKQAARVHCLNDKVQLVQADLLRLPFVDAFDLVTSFGAFGHIQQEDERRFVRGVWRVLRNEGRFVFCTTKQPQWDSPTRWAAEAFNAAMRVRNRLWQPPFIMYYLTFTLNDAVALLRSEGFVVRTRQLDPPWRSVYSVMATKPSCR